MALQKIISGGQSGVDRGALDAALSHGFPCGGWCPPGRLAEDGAIAAVYPLSEMETGGYKARTRQNVLASDGTVVIHFGELEGGTERTARQCALHFKPHLLIDAKNASVAQAAERMLGFIEAHSIAILNVAGPRQSKAPGAREYAYDVIGLMLQMVKKTHSSTEPG